MSGAPASGFQLVPLDCPTCGAPLAAEGEDVVYYCTACRNGYRLAPAPGPPPPPPPPSGAETDPAPRRAAPAPRPRVLEPVEVAFVATPAIAAELYLPFWLLPARVTISRRDATGGGFSGLLRFFSGDDKPNTPSGGRGTFAVPAFDAPLAAASELARRYTEALPGLGEKLGERLVGGRYGVEDAQKLAHWALVATEVGKPDLLRHLAYEIEFGPARLLGVPFVRRGGGRADAIFGVAVG